MKNTISFLLIVFAIAFCSQADGGSATWKLNPTNNLWNTAENWTPATVPNSETDVATFGVSNITDVIVGESADFDGLENMVNAIVFTPGASAYTLRSAASQQPDFYFDIIEFFGAGIVNNSGKMQNLVVEAAPGPEEQQPAVIYFQNSSSAGENVTITNQGSGSNIGIGVYGGGTNFGFKFTGTPSAGKATIINEGGKVSGTIEGGTTDLLSYSTAEAATFINQPGGVDGAAAGSTFVNTGGNIGSSTFINNAATVTGAEGGWTEIDIGVCAGASFIANGATSAGPQGGQVYTYGGAGSASFTAKGGEGSGAQGGLLEIHNIANSNQTVVTAEGGSNGGLGGMIVIEGLPTSLDQVQFQMLGNATMELTDLFMTHTITIGSLSGDGTVSLSRYILNIGSNNLDTTFSGVIQDKGGLGKEGSGTLTLSGASIYRGGTTVTAGTLVVSNTSGSATGTGSVSVNGGTLGGGGTISGAVTIGMGSGGGGTLQPSVGTTRKVALTIQGLLTFKSDATYSFRLKSRAAEVIANGVTIEGGAQFSLTAPNRILPVGKSATVIKNTAATAISGAFANLPDGGSITSGGNTFQANYQGGDGNDLTLTVVP